MKLKVNRFSVLDEPSRESQLSTSCKDSAILLGALSALVF
jgi:hypothetical protein